VREKFIIVVADDDLDDQQIIKDGLRDCRVKVEINSVYNGLQLMDYLLAREAYRNIKELPDLVLLDLNMPLMDGFEVLKEIRSKEKLKALPLYVITTSRSAEHKKRALELGATGFYSKGASSKDIRKIMAEICQECFDPSAFKGKASAEVDSAE
jgi:two-component system response regulator